MSKENELLDKLMQTKIAMNEAFDACNQMQNNSEVENIVYLRKIFEDTEQEWKILKSKINEKLEQIKI